MAWASSHVGLAGLVLTALCLALAVVIYASNPRRLQNRLLALVLLGRGGSSLGGIGLMYLTDDVHDSFAWQIAGWVAYAPVPWLYVAFLSTLATPFAPALARARPLLYAVAAASLLWPLLDPRAFATSMVPGSFSIWDVGSTGPGRTFAITAASIVAGVLGLGVAILALRASAPGTTARAQAVAYLLAFVSFDVTNVGVSLWQWTTGTFPLWLLYAEMLLTLAFVLLLAYGVLKAQLFDIDLKVKWTIRQSTIAAIFVGVFFVVSEAAAAFFTERIGTYAGLAAAGLLVFALAPLQRAAERLSDRAMPLAAATPAYLAFRKMEVYKAAVEEATADGALTEKDRRILGRLRAQLGLREEDARALEADVLQKEVA